MEHKYCAENDKIRIRPLHQCDIEHLRLWRNDSELSRYLSPIPYITLEKQNEWYRNYINDSNTIFFVVIDRERDIVIGSIAIYNFEKNTCEVGRILIGDPSSHGKGIGYNSLLLAIAVAIDKLNINLIKLEVHEDNIAARTIYEKAGFRELGRHPFIKGGIEIDMEILFDDFKNLNPSVASIKIYDEDSVNPEIGGCTTSKN